MKINEIQLKRLNGNAKIIRDNPTIGMIGLWQDWANANIKAFDSVGYTRTKEAESILPVIWVLSQIYSVAPAVIYAMFRKRMVLVRQASPGQVRQHLGFEHALTHFKELSKDIFHLGCRV